MDNTPRKAAYFLLRPNFCAPRILYIILVCTLPRRSAAKSDV